VPILEFARGLASRLRPRNSRQYILTAAAAVILLGGIGYLMFGRSDSASATTTTSTVAAGTFQTTVSASGTIDPADEADLDFQVSGRVTSVKVKAGDTVEKGDVLAKLDTVSLDAALASAEAQLEAAQTTAADDGSSSSTQQVSNNAAVASAAADVDTAKDNLAAATLKSTISGTVAAVNVAVGDQASGSSSSSSSSDSTGSTGASGGSGGTGGTGTGSSSSSSSSTSSTTAAVTVVTPKKFVVDVDVAATDIKQVKKGLQVQITPNGATTPIFGTVKDVGLVAETSSTGAATFPVTVSVTGSQSGLYAGTTADVSIIVKQVTNVLSVPTLALTTSGGKTYVQKVDGSGTKKTAVTVGQTYGASTEITAGLKAGDKVQLTTPTQLRTGTGARTGGTGGGGGFGGGGGGFTGQRPGGTGGFGGGGQ
jgi:multidrug efflux pump subunit AcrA (membrane-fusion protein)